MSLKLAWLVGTLLVAACQNLPEKPKNGETTISANPGAANAAATMEPSETWQTPVNHPGTEAPNTGPAKPVDIEPSRGIRAIPTKPGPGQDHFLI